MNLLKRQLPLDIPPEDPFRNDRLGYKETGFRVRRLIAQIEGPFVLAVNADWGVGKTTFLRMLKAQLESEQTECLLFDAWENDFADSPLAALVSELSGSIRGGGETKDRLLEAGRKAASLLSAKGAAKLTTIVLKGIARKAFGEKTIDEAEDLVKDIQDATEAAIEHQIGDTLDKYKSEKEALKNFTKALRGFANEVRSPKGSVNRPPVVLFVDELDRCRADYAVEFLEVAKHLFSVEGIVFVLAINGAQLANAIRGLYGEKFDAERYLRRFVDVQLDLPVPEIRKYAPVVLESSLGNDLLLPDGNTSADQIYLGRKLNRRTKYSEAVSELLVQLAAIRKWAARDIEQLAVKLAVVLRLVEQPERLDPILLVCCVVALYEKAEDSVQALREKGTSGLKGILQQLSLPLSPAEGDDPVLALVPCALDYFIAAHNDSGPYKTRLKELQKILQQQDLSPAGHALHGRMFFYLKSIPDHAGFRETADAALLTAQIVTDPARQLESEQDSAAH